MRLILTAVAIVAALVASTFATRAFAFQDDEPESGGLGLTRAEWEAAHGTGEAAEGPAIPFDAVYAYENDAYVVSFSGSKEEESSVVMYIELAWPEPIAWAAAVEAAERLLPADAEPTGAYAAPPTPSGPTALTIQQFESEWLSGVSYGTGQLHPDILVIYHQQVVDLTTPPALQQSFETTVTRVNLMVRIPEG
jgi:hypothetical protein